MDTKSYNFEGNINNIEFKASYGEAQGSGYGQLLKNKKGSDTPKNVRKEERALYEKVKSEVRMLEDRNFSRLILFDSGKGWYKMVGNSLLIYYYEIMGKYFRNRPNIQPDTDYTKTIFEEGVLSFRGVEGISKKLKKVNALKETRTGKNTVVFELNFELTRANMQDLRNELKLERERALGVIKPKINVNPKMYDMIRRCQRRIFETVRKTSAFEREYVGMDVVQESRKMMKVYLLLNENMISEDEAWRRIFEIANNLVMEIVMIVELKTWRQETAVSIGAELIKIKREAEKLLNKDGVVESAGILAKQAKVFYR